MITLAGEILYYKHKDVIDSKLRQIKPGKKKVAVAKPPTYPISQITGIQPKRRLLLSENYNAYSKMTYRPTGPGKMMPRVSYISVFPKDRPIYE